VDGYAIRGEDRVSLTSPGDRSRVDGAAGVHPSTTPRLQGIEGLRAIAAGSIVLVHVWGFSTPGGALGAEGGVGDALSALSVGVTLFFTLSAFLLYRPFAATIARNAPPLSTRAYFRNRILRIAPAYWVILFACAVVLGSVYLPEGAGIGRLTEPIPFLESALLLQNYRPSTLLTGISPAWSLAVELVFYLALPVLVVGAAWLARRAKDRNGRVLALMAPPLLLLLVGLSGKLVAGHVFPASPTAGYGNNLHSVVERSFWNQADLFTFGMVVAVLYVEVVDGRLRLPSYWRPAAAALGFLIFLPCAWTMHQGEHSYLLQNTGEALALALLFAAIVVPDPRDPRSRRVIGFLESPVLVAVGVASYSIFLWHQPLIVWLTDHGLTVGGWGGLLVNTLILAIPVGILSALTYRFVEKPALRLKHSMRAEAPPIPADGQAARPGLADAAASARSRA
jgi:peptidoglycan/LPS O-acetylase OafA/YrhL